MPFLGRLSQVRLASFETTTATLTIEATKSLGTGLGFTFAPSESRVFGLSLGVQKLWDSPGLNKPMQVCTATREGVDDKGNAVRAAKVRGSRHRGAGG